MTAFEIETIIVLLDLGYMASWDKPLKQFKQEGK
jgi:hypothetical protein